MRRSSTCSRPSTTPDASIGCLNILQYKLTSEQMMEVLDEVERFPNGGTH
jgi:hypothetical protein